MSSTACPYIYAAEIATHISGDTLVIKTSIGEKLGVFVMSFGSFVTGFAVGFSKVRSV